MKTTSLTSPPLTYPAHSLRLFDTAPLWARYELLCAAMVMLTDAGQLGRLMSVAQKVRRVVRAFVTLDKHNVLVRRKLEMLSHKPWRDLVLRELGGMRRLKNWEAAHARITAELANPSKPARPTQDEDVIPAWLLTPERIAESERLKAYKRMCGRATAHPLIFRDTVKMDFDGLFRLPPLPRVNKGPRQIKVYTQATIIDYDWNNIRIAKETGFGPAWVWPVEFHAAIALEKRYLAKLNDCHSGARSESGRSRRDMPKPDVLKPNESSNASTFRVPPCGPGMTEESETEERKTEEGKTENGIPIIPLEYILSPKVMTDFFGGPTG